MRRLRPSWGPSQAARMACQAVESWMLWMQEARIMMAKRISLASGRQGQGQGTAARPPYSIVGLVVHRCGTHGVTQLRWLAGSNETPPFRKHPSALDSFDSFDSFDLVDPVGPVDPLDRLWQRSRSWHLFDLTAACSLGRGQLQKMNPRNRPRR
jgi:hypothetical protein